MTLARLTRSIPLPRATGAWRDIAPAFVALGVVVVAAALLPFVAGPYFQEVGYRMLQLAALATAWNLMAGYAGLVSLGSAAFIGLGMYAAALAANAWALPTLPLVVIGGLAAAVFAIVVSPAMFRLRGLYFTIGTLALAEALRLLMINLPTFGGASGIVVRAQALAAHELYWWALGIAAGAALVVVGILASPLSLSMRGVRDDEDVASQMGVFTFRIKLLAFAVAALVMGAVGGLQAIRLGVIEPYGGFGIMWSVDIVAVAIIGGLGTRAGPWIGAIFYVLLGELLRDYPEIHIAVTVLVLIAVIRFAPLGIWGTIVEVWRRWRNG